MTDETILQNFWQQVIAHFSPGLHDQGAVVDQLSSLFISKSYSRNEYLVLENEPWKHFFFVGSGLCRMYYCDLEGDEHNKNFFMQGQCFWPILERYQTQSCPFNIQAIEPSEIFLAKLNQVEERLKKVGLWDAFYKKTVTTVLEDKLNREHDWLKLTAKGRYQKLMQVQPIWLEHIPDYHLASYLGISPVSLSRLKASLDS